MTLLVAVVDLSKGYTLVADQDERHKVWASISEESWGGWKDAAEALSLSVTQMINVMGHALREARVVGGAGLSYNNSMALTEILKGWKT